MGKKRRHNQSSPRDDNWQHKAPRPEDAQRKARNAKRFENYYRQQLGLDDEEWARVMATFRKPLPATFRVTAPDALAAKIERELVQVTDRCDAKAKALREAGPSTADVKRFSRDADPAATAHAYHRAATAPLNLQSLAWIPKRRAWRVDIERSALRKSPAHKELHTLLVAHERAGTITRQEAVSMVPPLFLGAKPGDRVLDTCAAPGSKTSQLIEAVFPPGSGSLTDATGLVVANDEDLKRTHTLVHQLKRLGAPCWAATHGDARMVPTPRDASGGKVLYDKVLADVPCSSDGTLRKTPGVLERWSTASGASLHALQAAIGVKAAQLVKPGGTLVYSTCSLNPLEDEAVVAELLRTDPSLSVVSDSRECLPRRHGLETWKVLDDCESDSLTEYARDQVPEERSRRFQPSTFPPLEERIRAQLKNCMRFLPHDGDAGGFFVAVLRKDGSEAGAKEPVVLSDKGPKKPDSRQLSEDVKYVRFQDVADTKPLAAFFGLETFPWELLVCRSGDDNEMATTATAKKIVLATPACAALCVKTKQLKLRVVHAGVIAFCRTSESARCEVNYRLSQDVVDLILPFLTKRRVACERADFEKLLEGGSHNGAEAFSPSVTHELAALSVGSVVFVLEDGSGRPPACVAWRGAQGFVSVFAGKEDLVVLRSRITAE